MELFWIFTTVVFAVLLLIFALRQGAMGWAWNFLLMSVILFIALFKMTGIPRDALFFAMIENLHGEMEVVTQIVVPHKFVYLLLRKTPGDQPSYVRLAWTKPIEDELNSAAMKAKEQQTALLVNIDQLSSWSIQESGFGIKGSINAKPNADAKSKASDDESNSPGGGHGDKEGGESMFYPRPVQADPLKTPVHNKIQIH